MLASALIEEFQAHDLILVGRRAENVDKLSYPYLDTTSSDFLKELESVSESADLLIHCAAMTDVDGCEDESEKALFCNAGLLEKITSVLNPLKTHLIYVSTDYVFDGAGDSPYQETDPVNPISIYGKTKLVGEEVAKKYGSHTILRASWLFGGGASYKNFVNTIAGLLLGGQKTFDIVTDQRGSPSYVGTLARVILALGEAFNDKSYSGNEVFHFSNRGECSFYEVAERIVASFGTEATLNKTTLEERKMRAKRPPYSKLDTKKIEKLLNISIPDWESDLELYLEQYKQEKGKN